MSINKILSTAVEKISMEYGVRIDSVNIAYEKTEMLNGESTCFIRYIKVDAQILEPVIKDVK